MRADKPDMGAESHDEASLIERARNGDVDAFTLLVESHQDRICNVIFRSLHDREVARDIAQEVFLQAWKTIERFDDRAKFSTWLYRVAMNAVVSHVRHRNAQKRGGTASEISLHANPERKIDPSADLRLSDGNEMAPDARLEAEETQSEVMAAIHTLDAETRDVIILRDIEGLSYDQVAEVLDVNVGTVRSRLHRGRERLREKLRHLVSEGDE